MQIHVKQCKKRIISPSAPHGTLFLHSHQPRGVQKGSFTQMYEIVGNNHLLQFSAAGSSQPWAPSTPQGSALPAHEGWAGPEQLLGDISHPHQARPAGTKGWWQYLICINPKVSTAPISRAGGNPCWGLPCEWLPWFDRSNHHSDWGVFSLEGEQRLQCFQLLTWAYEMHAGILGLYSLGQFF